LIERSLKAMTSSARMTATAPVSPGKLKAGICAQASPDRELRGLDAQHAVQGADACTRTSRSQAPLEFLCCDKASFATTYRDKQRLCGMSPLIATVRTRSTRCTRRCARAFRPQQTAMRPPPLIRARSYPSLPTTALRMRRCVRTRPYAVPQC
jgi:hypothetical protein